MGFFEIGRQRRQKIGTSLDLVKILSEKSFPKRRPQPYLPYAHRDCNSALSFLIEWKGHTLSHLTLTIINGTYDKGRGRGRAQRKRTRKNHINHLRIIINRAHDMGRERGRRKRMEEEDKGKGQRKRTRSQSFTSTILDSLSLVLMTWVKDEEEDDGRE